jgi:peroxiredoxin Q/BCP
MNVSIGDTAPNFTLKRDGGDTVTLSDHRGQPVVVYFYPKDDTPGCTKEACGFRDHFDQFEDHGITVIGISKDDVKSHDKFKNKYNLPFILASDPDGQVADDYGVWKEKSMFGRTFMGMNRTTFLIDAEGKISHVWPKVSVTDHASEVLEKVAN